MTRPPRRSKPHISPGWSLPDDVLHLLNDPSLNTRDMIELVVVAYSNDHGGNAPSMAEIAGILGINKVNVQRGIDELIAMERAQRIDGKLVIKNSEYSHPLIKKFHRR